MNFPQRLVGLIPRRASPERWMLTQLDTDEGCQLLAEELNEDVPTTKAFLGMLSTMTAFHSLSYELAERTGLDQKAVLRSLIRSIGRLSTDTSYGSGAARKSSE